MFTIQVDKTIQLIIKIFYRLGIWQTDEESNYRKIGKKLFYSFLGTFFPIFFAANAFLCDDRIESVFSVQISITATIAYVKILYILFEKQEILTFVCDPIVVHSIENREEYDETVKKINKFMNFVRMYCLATFVTVPVVVLIKLPIFSTDKGLPLFISFSWNRSEIVYWLAYLFLSLSCFLYAVMNLITVLIWYMMLNYSIDYELLGNKFRKLGVVKKTIAKRAKKQKQFRLTQRSGFVQDLIVLVKTHRNLAKTIERFRSFFSTLFLVQITTSGITICTSVYSLAFTSNQNIVQPVFYVVVLLYAIFDIFLVMYLANDITVTSDRLSYCLFESNWIEQTQSCKKHVLIMGEVLKQPQQLVVLIYPMNLETFMTIVNGAYSMFNILKSLQ
ncbi:odorant receptor 30a-like [Bradysia coprophila]|uniref:odorant receptor 30a-like n=1 Tax=Bradysia coprophila TaxID=38358 RepID=UPI00187D714A|nr:odorant receptor 30a-like [Bradysia coprophila]XP_037040975.1 odorant receptor 30a-like [Bradysia coprophila]